MGIYSFAVVALCSATVLPVFCFNSLIPSNSSPQRSLDFVSLRKVEKHGLSSKSASLYSNYDENENRVKLEWKKNVDKISSSTASFENMLAAVNDDDEADESFESSSYQAKSLDRLSANSYTINLPITSTEERSIGMSLRQVGKGNKISDLALSIDNLGYIDALTESIPISSDLDDPGTDGKNSDVRMDRVNVLNEAALTNLFENNFGPDFEGVIVSEVVENGLAWNAGVRLGDVLLTTSATIGDKVWPKSTLEGVRSAFSSRKVVSSSITLQFRRSRATLDATEVVEKFELSLYRPMGINIADQQDGSVLITGFTPDSKNSIVHEALRVGDRIVAVDSTVGKKMWPVSNVEGLVSACTTRLPGQPIRLRFERIVDVGEFKSTGSMDVSENMQPTAAIASDQAKASLVGAVDGFRNLKEVTTTAVAKGAPVSIESTGSNTHKILLSRSRDLLSRYKLDKSVATETRSALNKLSAVVADRVLEALADASAPLDAKTLSLVMNAYIDCRMPDKAVRAFEAAVGIAGDGSVTIPENKIKSKKGTISLVRDLNALDLYTATSLLQAHALNGNYKAAQRVLAAMEGRAGTNVDNVVSMSWPLKEKTDVRCYNIALAAAAKAGGKKGINTAIEIFDNMESPSKLLNKDGKMGAVTRNLVTYNTMIGALAKQKSSQDALTIFYSMKDVGVRPDKYTYTSLLKALVEDGDINGGRELLQEMKEVGVEIDVVTYNTMIKALCENLQWFKAKELVTEMELNGIIPNSLTYGLLMNGLMKADKPSTCLTLFEAACADERTSTLMENVQLYTTAITAASRIGNYERAVELVARMKRAGVKPNLKTLTSLMSACISAKQIDQALEVFNQTVKMSKASESFKLDGFILTLAIRAYCEHGDFTSASEILTAQKDGYHEMSGRDIMYGYNYFIEFSLKQEKYDVARAAMSELLQSGYIPSKHTLENIISALGLNKSEKPPIEQNKSKSIVEERDLTKLKFLLFVLDSISKRNLSISAPLYTAILNEGVRVGGLGKKIASLIGNTRADARGTILKQSANQNKAEEVHSWERLLQMFESGHYNNKRKEDLNLPQLHVTIGKRELGKVIAAESPVVYRSRYNERQAKMRKFRLR